jgi:radical SAM protein with 4Fe4S-binding SPASM domain
MGVLMKELKRIIFEVTSRCNLNCTYCYNIWKRPGVANHEHFDSYSDAKKTLKRIFKIADIGHVTFTGGEPLISERFPELVLLARMKGANVTIISNGNAGDRDYYKSLIDIGADFFEFPLHSHSREIHDGLTRVKGSHRKVIESIKAVQELGGRLLVDLVLNKQNIPEIERTVKFIKGLGVDRIMITRFNIGGEGIKHRKELTPSKKELQDAFHVLDELVESESMNITSNVCTPLCVLDPRDYKNINTMSCSASAESMPLTLDINGNMRMCNHSPVYFGNIYKEKLEDIFSSKYVKFWKETVPDYCTDCGVYEHCYGGCRAASEQLGLGLGIVDPIVEIS